MQSPPAAKSHAPAHSSVQARPAARHSVSSGKQFTSFLNSAAKVANVANNVLGGNGGGGNWDNSGISGCGFDTSSFDTSGFDTSGFDAGLQQQTWDTSQSAASDPTQ